MTVKELILELQKLDENTEVVIASDNFELNCALISANYCSKYDNAKKTERQFRDAFDGDTYSQETWSILGGNEKIFIIS